MTKPTRKTTKAALPDMPASSPKPTRKTTKAALPDMPASAPKPTRQFTTFDRFGNIIAGAEVRLEDGTVKHSNAQGHVWLPIGEVHQSEFVIK